MLQRINELSDIGLKIKLQQAKVMPPIDGVPDSGGEPNPAVQCPAEYLKDGKNYRLEPKPLAREHILKKYGHKYERINGVLHAHVPLGTHGTDHIGIDPKTREIGCCLCQKVLVKP